MPIYDQYVPIESNRKHVAKIRDSAQQYIPIEFIFKLVESLYSLPHLAVKHEDVGDDESP